MSVMLAEQETNVNFTREDSRAIIYTSDTTTMTKLNKLVELEETEWKLESVSKLPTGEVVGRTYSCPKEFISFRSKRTSRTYTDEERKAMADRMADRLRKA